MSAGPRPSTTPRPLTDLVAAAGEARVAGSDDPARVLVTGVTHDSRAVVAGDLYAALPGFRTHGAEFVAQAAAAGAVAVLTDPAGEERAVAVGLPVLVADDPRAVLGAVASTVYGDPSHDLLVVGITGTNGKTTTSYLVDAGLRAAGLLTGVIGTVGTRIGDETVPTVRTTPEATDVHALLAVMRERGVRAVTMEVSSHALRLGRVDGVRFDVAGFTNLSPDHLDFHTDMDDYFDAKAQLLTPASATARRIARRRSPRSVARFPAIVRTPRITSRRITAGSSLRGLSSVTITRSAPRTAASPIANRLCGSRSPPAPRTTMTRPPAPGRASATSRAATSARSTASGVCA